MGKTELREQQEVVINSLDVSMSKDITEMLMYEYPGYSWGVRVDGAQGVAHIYCLNVSGETGYLCHLSAIYSASQWKDSVLDHAGSILERFNLSRVTASQAEIAALKTDFAGRVLGAHGEKFREGVSK